MKPVMQTVTGPRGNCMSACMASILEIPLDAVPNFYEAGPDDSDYWNAARAWLKGYGLGIITLTFTSPAQWVSLRLDGYHIVSWPSPRGNDMCHATVWHKGAMVHDPHPDQNGIVAPEQLDMLYVLDPHRLVRVGPSSTDACGVRGGDTPKPMQGTWALTAPDGRTWRAESPLRVVAMEQRERIPERVALERIFAAASDSESLSRIDGEADAR